QLLMDDLSSGSADDVSQNQQSQGHDKESSEMNGRRKVGAFDSMWTSNGLSTQIAAFFAAILAILLGCERAPAPQSPATAPASSNRLAPLARIEMNSVTALPPKLVTHLSVDGLGNVYYVQEG